MSISGNASLKARLRVLKADAEEHPNVYGATWREVFARTKYRRYPSNGGTWQSDENAREYPALRGAYLCDHVPDGWRVKGDAHEVARSEGSRRIDHTGWYTDNFHDGLAIGFVLQIPARDGVPQFVPGVRYTNRDGVTLYPLDRDESALEAAFAADRYAEILAESDREFDAKQLAGFKIDEAKQDIATARVERRQLIRAIRETRPAQPTEAHRIICRELRARIAELKDDSAKAYQQIEKLQDNYWNAVPNY